MYRFPLMLCLILFIASCAISKAELVGEIAPTVRGSDVIMKQIVTEERQEFDKKRQAINDKKQQTLDEYKKVAPAAAIQKKNIEVKLP